MNRTGLGSFTILCFLSIVSLMGLAFNIPPVRAIGTIYIRANGSVEGTDKIPSADNVTYTFTDNINDSIVVERSNIVVDGSGYMLNGFGLGGAGFNLQSVSNVTIANTNVNGFRDGIVLSQSSGNSIVGNNIIANSVSGIYLGSSSDNSIFKNNIENNGDGILIAANNNITASDSYGIYTCSSSENKIFRNNITNNRCGIMLAWHSCQNTIVENNITNNEDGVLLYESCNCNSVYANIIVANRQIGMGLHNSSSNVLRHNTMSENRWNFWVSGSTFPFLLNDVDSSNTVDDKAVCYWINESDRIVPSDAGYVALVNCSHITMQNLRISNQGEGVLLAYTTNSVISRNEMVRNYVGIALLNSSDNIIACDNITGSGDFSIYDAGIFLESSSNNNVSGNIIMATGRHGIHLDLSSNNSITRNNITNNQYGIELSAGSSGNILRSNSMVNNSYNFHVEGWSLSDFINDIDVSNIVDDKPIYYWISRADTSVPFDAGYVALVNCSRITAENLNLTRNQRGLLLVYTMDSTITQNNLMNNRNGIYLQFSSNNSITRNNIKNNSFGIGFVRSNFSSIVENNIANNDAAILLEGSSNNSIYHNDFINNTNQAYVHDSTNLWDNGYPSGGNYWSDYSKRYPNATEIDDSGIWNTPYFIDANNKDNYPMIPEFPSFLILTLFMMATLLAVIVRARRFMVKHSCIESSAFLEISPDDRRRIT